METEVGLADMELLFSRTESCFSTASKGSYSRNRREAESSSHGTRGSSTAEIKWDQGGVAFTKPAFVSGTAPWKMLQIYHKSRTQGAPGWLS